MVFNAKEIELFKNLSQYYVGDLYFDFHNEFDCISIKIKSDLLTLVFKKINTDFNVSLEFRDVTIENIELDYTSEIKNLTIDNLYRGRFETNGQLVEFGLGERSYFYLEFYENQKMEFFSSSFEIKVVEE